MKVLELAIFSSDSLGSFGDSLLAIGRELKAHGDSITVCFPEAKRWMQVFKDEGFEVEILPIRPWAARLLSILVKKHKIDIIHTHFGLESQIIAGITKLFFSPNVKIVLHWRSPPYTDTISLNNNGVPRFILTMKRAIGNLGYRFLNKTCVSANIAISKYIQNILHRRKIRNVKVIYNGIDLNKYNPDIIDTSTSHIPHSTLIGNISNFMPPKDHITFIDSVKLVLQKYPEIKFILVGDGPTRPQVATYAKRLGITDSLIFTGMQEDVRRFIKDCSFTVLSSFHEGFGNVIIESMALKKPVIATNVGGVPEIVKDGENGLLVPRKNPTVMAEKILYLIEHPEATTELGENGRRLVEQKFTTERWAKEVREVFLKVLNM